MRVELINIPFTDNISSRLDPPLFLLQIAPIFQKENYAVRVNDLNGINRNHWGFGSCPLYVIYADINSYSVAVEISRMCREINNKSAIIVCGSGPSKYTGKYANTRSFNVVIKGEAELSVANFLTDIIHDVDSVQHVYSEEVRNVNRLPFPARNLVEMNTYARRLDGMRATMIMGSRGSPFGPTWLCKKLKLFSINRIKNEVVGVVNKYGIKNFFFGDTTFTFNEQRALDIGKVMANKNLLFGFNDVISEVKLPLYKELIRLGAREVFINPIGASSQEEVSELKSQIASETGMRVIVRKDAKYQDRRGSNNGKGNNNGKQEDSML